MTSRIIELLVRLSGTTAWAEGPDAPAIPDEAPDWLTRFGQWLDQHWQTFSAWLHGVLDPIVETIKPHTLDPLDRVLDGIPMWVALATVIGLFVFAAVVCCCLRRKYVFRGAPDGQRWRDLRIWSVLLVLPYILVYIIFGL